MQLYPFTSTKMGFMASVSRPPRPIFFEKRTQADSFKHGSFSKLHIFAAKRSKLPSKRPDSPHSLWSSEGMAILVGSAGIALASVVGPSHAAEYPILSEPSNALSLPTWAVHVSSVVEWTTAMALVWRYGETSGYESWKGLSWGMVPLLGGAICACTWHFFYNSESLEVLVALQAALTVIGNATMCIAAYRIYTSSQESSKNP